MKKENSTGRRISNFVLSRKMELEKVNREMARVRVQRLKSSIFELPEFAESPMVTLCTCSQEEFEVNDIAFKEWEVLIDKFNNSEMNDCSKLNQLGLTSKGKVIILMVEKINMGDLQTMVNQIVNSREAMLCLNAPSAIAMTSDIFYELRGLDELFENLSDAFVDFALRAEMAGVYIYSLKEINFRSIELSKRNIKKGRIVVNQGSPRFIDFDS